MTIEFYSLEQQDEFIFNIFNYKTNGTFLDVSCWHPVGGSNSYTLENQFGWTGFGFDINDSNTLYSWNTHRTSPFVQMDVLSKEFTQYLKDNIPAGEVIDYVSLDVDGLATVQALENIIAAGVKFKAVTFEHEFFIHNEIFRDASRKILEDLGFVRLFSDIKLLTVNMASQHKINDTESFEDWWIHPDYFDKNLLTISATSLYYKECIELLKKFKNADYTCTHHCCKAFPDEYTYYLDTADVGPMLELFERIKLLNQGTL